MKMTLHHHPPHKLNVINISAVPNPILTKLQTLDCVINNNNNKSNIAKLSFNFNYNLVES